MSVIQDVVFWDFGQVGHFFADLAETESGTGTNAWVEPEQKQNLSRNRKLDQDQRPELGPIS
ncbi:MAG: hypothetical protein II318_08325 [Bacteroidales bacterium]|nr:hypothetical protein [Bacteroidales bacterium]MBQ2244194.1 hypothetical protein [Bacteroidales bacterium]